MNRRVTLRFGTLASLDYQALVGQPTYHFRLNQEIEYELCFWWIIDPKGVLKQNPPGATLAPLGIFLFE